MQMAETSSGDVTAFISSGDIMPLMNTNNKEKITDEEETNNSSSSHFKNCPSIQQNQTFYTEQSASDIEVNQNKMNFKNGTSSVTGNIFSLETEEYPSSIQRQEEISRSYPTMKKSDEESILKDQQTSDEIKANKISTTHSASSFDRTCEVQVKNKGEIGLKQESDVWTAASITVTEKDQANQMLIDTQNPLKNEMDRSQQTVKTKEEMQATVEIREPVPSSCAGDLSLKHPILVTNRAGFGGHNIIAVRPRPHLPSSDVGTNSVVSAALPKILMLKSPLSYVRSSVPGTCSLATKDAKKIVIIKNKQGLSVSGTPKLVSFLNTASSNESVMTKDIEQRTCTDSTESVKKIPEVRVYPENVSDLVTVVRTHPKETNMYVKPKMKKIYKGVVKYIKEDDEEKLTESNVPRPRMRSICTNYGLRKRDRKMMKKMREACNSDSEEDPDIDKDYIPSSVTKEITNQGIKRKGSSNDEIVILSKSTKTKTKGLETLENGKFEGEIRKEMEQFVSNANEKDCNMDKNITEIESRNTSSSQVHNLKKALPESSEIPLELIDQSSEKQFSVGESTRPARDDSEWTTEELVKEVKELSKLVCADDNGNDGDIELSMQVETEDELLRNHADTGTPRYRRKNGKFISKIKYERSLRMEKMNREKQENRKKRKENFEQEEETENERSVKEKQVTVYCYECLCNHPQGICSTTAKSKKLTPNKITIKMPPKVIKNKKVGSCKNSGVKALVTLPNELSLSYVDDAHGFGIFTTEDLPPGTQMGPVEGELRTFSEMSKEQDLSNVWIVQHDVFKEESPDDKNYICMDDEMSSNWCRYIRATTLLEKSNLKCVLDENSNIYLKTRRHVEAGEELLYFIRGHQIDEDVATEDERTCPRCKMTFDSTVLYAKHILVFHTYGKCKYKSYCKICRKIFHTGANLSKHCKEEHGGSGASQCKDCGKEFLSEKLLKSHWRSTHEDRGEYPCDICGKVFRNEIKLSNHRKNTHADASFKCETCGKVFKQRTTFVRHQNVHNPEPKGTCEFCGKQFRDSCNLKVHLLTHSKQKPFQCSECDAAYTTKQQLQFHYKKVHNYTADNMPEITRSVPYTMEAYSRKAETEMDAPRESDSEENSSKRSPTEGESDEDKHTEERSSSNLITTLINTCAVSERQEHEGRAKAQVSSESKLVNNNTRNMRNPTQDVPELVTRQLGRDRYQTSSYKRRDQTSYRKRDSPNLNSNMHQTTSSQKSHLWSHAPSVEQDPPYGIPYLEDTRHVPYRYPQPYASTDIHQTRMPNVHPSHFPNTNEFDARVMQLMEL